MNVFKKITLAVSAILALGLVGGYVYFDRKFSPPENFLTVSHEVRDIPIIWVASEDNAHSALLLPVKIVGVNAPLFMQLDFGSPSTLFYRRPLESIYEIEGDEVALDSNSRQVGLAFTLGEMSVSSSHFRLIDYGSEVDLEDADAQHIIGTIGTDLLEKRALIMDFKSDRCSFLASVSDSGYSDFQFKKRRILLPAVLDAKAVALLYDSGTSGYELITDQKTWEEFRTPSGPVKSETGNSWGNKLAVISAPSDKILEVGGVDLNLSEITHISGTSILQNLLMKSSGMDGMIGNKLFIHRKVTLDCWNERFKIE